MIFGVFFVPLKQFLQFLELFPTLKIKFKKKTKPIYRIRPSSRLDPTRPRPAGQARQAHRPAGHGRRRQGGWRARLGRVGPRAYKEAASPARAVPQRAAAVSPCSAAACQAAGG
jgi:hypothetical protein